jgi:hypothetical protein
MTKRSTPTAPNGKPPQRVAQRAPTPARPPVRQDPETIDIEDFIRERAACSP